MVSINYKNIILTNLSILVKNFIIKDKEIYSIESKLTLIISIQNKYSLKQQKI